MSESKVERANEDTYGVSEMDRTIGSIAFRQSISELSASR